jgi:hypothetical protein
VVEELHKKRKFVEFAKREIKRLQSPELMHEDVKGHQISSAAP